MNKDLIKYGLLLAGAYLIWKYIEDHGGLAAVMGGTATLPPPGVTPPVVQPPTTQPPTIKTIPPAPGVLDLTGLVTHADVNDSLTGTVKINGVPTTLSIITADGRIFDGTGSEVTAILVAKGVNVDALRQAFTANQSLSGLGAGYFPRPYWLN